MNRRLLPFFTFGTFILVVVLVLHTFGVTGTGKRLGFQTILRGMHSPVVTSGYYVIDDVGDWTRVWQPFVEAYYPDVSAPDVDFAETTVIAVFMGEGAGGFIEVKEIIDTGLSVIVKVEKTYPGENCIIPRVRTHPYHIVRVDKISKYIIFDTIESVFECG